MRQLTLKDFQNLPWRPYHSDNKCVHCNETANNLGGSLCNNHTDLYRRLSKEQEEKCFNKRIKELKIDLSQIEDIEFDDVNHNDSPDYVDAFITSASQDGIDLTDAQLDFINDSCRDFVYEKLMDYLY